MTYSCDISIPTPLQAKRRSLVPSARTIFEQLLEKDFRIAPDMIREALAQAGEG